MDLQQNKVGALRAKSIRQTQGEEILFGGSVRIKYVDSSSQFNFSSKFPRDVIDKARINSSNSMEPSWFSSKTLKTREANLDGSPLGKNCVQIFMNPCSVRRPLGQSFRNPLCHCFISFSETVKLMINVMAKRIHKMRRPSLFRRLDSYPKIFM